MMQFNVLLLICLSLSCFNAVSCQENTTEVDATPELATNATDTTPDPEFQSTSLDNLFTEYANGTEPWLDGNWTEEEEGTTEPLTTTVVVTTLSQEQLLAGNPCLIEYVDAECEFQRYVCTANWYSSVIGCATLTCLILFCLASKCCIV